MSNSPTSRPALIVVDVQRAFDQWEAAGKRRNNPQAVARIADLLSDGPTFTFEFFPPNNDEEQACLEATIKDLEPLHPSFVSVTYRGGRESRQRTHDLVAGMLAVLDNGDHLPFNIGNPVETTILEFARRIIELTRSSSEIVFHPLPVDDPKQRCPDIGRARSQLGWEPAVQLEEGLARTVEYFRDALPA